MAIWSEYMREKDRLEKAKCEACDGYGVHEITQGPEIVGSAICPACNGTGYKNNTGRRHRLRP